MKKKKKKKKKKIRGNFVLTRVNLSTDAYIHFARGKYPRERNLRSYLLHYACENRSLSSPRRPGKWGTYEIVVDKEMHD